MDPAPLVDGADQTQWRRLKDLQITEDSTDCRCAQFIGPQLLPVSCSQSPKSIRIASPLDGSLDPWIEILPAKRQRMKSRALTGKIISPDGSGRRCNGGKQQDRIPPTHGAVAVFPGSV